jgi:hypothetical protein
MNGTITAIN